MQSTAHFDRPANQLKRNPHLADNTTVSEIVLFSTNSFWLRITVITLGLCSSFGISSFWNNEHSVTTPSWLTAMNRSMWHVFILSHLNVPTTHTNEYVSRFYRLASKGLWNRKKYSFLNLFAWNGNYISAWHLRNVTYSISRTIIGIFSLLTAPETTWH